MWLANQPKIALHIEISEGALRSAHLELKDAFHCTGANPFILRWLEGYLKHKPEHISFNLENLSPFRGEVLTTLQKIPFGKTVSYGEIASTCGNPKASRAVGNACNKNPFPLLIPCHRVISSNGGIGGFALNLEIKRRLLEFEAS